MAVTAPNALSGTPVVQSNQFVLLNAGATTNTINPGDWVYWRGTASGLAGSANAAMNKASGIGIALDRNPAKDWAGRDVVNSALLVARHGIFRVSASFSGVPALGTLAAPDATGSGVNAASGQTGLGATWNTATPVSVSGGTAAVGAVFGVGQVINWFNSGPAGTGQMDVAVWDRNADYY